MKNKFILRRLSDIGTLERGGGLQKNDFTENGVPCIHYGQIFTHYCGFAKTTISFVPPTTAKTCTPVHKGDIILAITSENVQDLCKSVVWLGNDDIVTGGHSGVFRHNQNPKYLGYFFQSELFQCQKAKYAKGTKVIEINPDDILNRIKIGLPDLETQQKIIQILEKCDAIIEALQQKNKYEERKFQWLLNCLICANANHKTEKLGNLAKITTGKKDVNQGCSGGKYPFFTCAQKHTWSNDYSFDGEAICIAGNGEIGHSTYYNGKFEAYQRTYVLMNFKIPGKYMYYVIGNLFKSMVECQKQMSAMPYIKLKTLQEFEVPLYDAMTTSKIINILDNQTSYISCNQRYIAALKKIRKYLLNHLISGDLDLSNIKLEEEESK